MRIVRILVSLCICNLGYSSFMERIYILGVGIDPVSRVQALEMLLGFLEDDAQRHVMTPNSEMIVEAQHHSQFFTLLNRSALNLPDSAGLLWAARRLGKEIPERVPGVDIVGDLCGALSSEHPVFFLGAREGVAQKAAAALKARNPNLTIAGCHGGSPSESDAAAIIEMINQSDARVLFVAYGAPKQDVWIDRYLKDMPKICIAMGVGGTFDFLAGTQKRAPQWIGKSGLEWAWRFTHEPSRYKRMWNAVIRFPLLVLLAKHRRGAAQ
jgi:N-acetylglucosaminyldiphosphoundecaprenol N-acetyl-beta-D-mannosaminyltransferase